MLRHHLFLLFFFFNDTATTEIYTLSLHDALPISAGASEIMWTEGALKRMERAPVFLRGMVKRLAEKKARELGYRSEEHTSELQSPCNLVCRLLLEKKKKKEKRLAKTYI